MKTSDMCWYSNRRQDKLEIQKPDRIGKSIRLYVGVSGLL